MSKGLRGPEKGAVSVLDPGKLHKRWHSSCPTKDEGRLPGEKKEERISAVHGSVKTQRKAHHRDSDDTSLTGKKLLAKIKGNTCSSKIFIAVSFTKENWK